MPSLLHQIRKGDGETISGVLPATAYPIGTALMIGSIDTTSGAKTFVLANGRVDGFMTRASRVGIGTTDTEQLMGFGLETPFQPGYQGSVEHATELEVEGADYILSTGTGAITSGTPLNTDLSFKNGKLYVGQTGDINSYRLLAIMGNPVVSGNLRIYVVAIKGYKV